MGMNDQMALVAVLLQGAPGKAAEPVGEFELNRVPCVGELIRTVDKVYIVKGVVHEARRDGIYDASVVCTEFAEAGAPWRIAG